MGTLKTRAELAQAQRVATRHGHLARLWMDAAGDPETAYVYARMAAHHARIVLESRITAGTDENPFRLPDAE